MRDEATIATPAALTTMGPSGSLGGSEVPAPPSSLPRAAYSIIRLQSACGAMSLSLAVPIGAYMNAALSPPRSEPAKAMPFDRGRPEEPAHRGNVGEL